MKLTSRGKDFLKALLAGTLIGTILDATIILALCFALSFAALMSGAILRSSTAKNFRIDLDTEDTSCFKGEEVRATMTVESLRGRLVTLLPASLKPPKSIQGEILALDSQNFLLIFEPRYSGRFVGLTAKFDLLDPAGLFRKIIEFKWDNFAIDCYPSSILEPSAKASPASISLGEREGKSKGLGMEFYSIDDYNPLAETKSIHWKKVASLPNERLLVKTRVTSIKKSITISLILTGDRGEDMFQWLDSACEGIAMLGKTIFDMGCVAELLFGHEGRVASRRTASLRELLEAIMQLSAAGVSNFDTVSLLLANADICVTGFKELQNEMLAAFLQSKIVLLIEDEGWLPARLGRQAVVYSPYLDYSLLVGRAARL